MKGQPFDERVGHALGSGDLSADARRVTDTDLIAAFALSASKVGAACWRMKYGQDIRHVKVRAVVAKIARAIAGPFRRPGPMMMLVAAEGLYEWLHDTCRTCHGRGWVGFAMCAVEPFASSAAKDRRMLETQDMSTTTNASRSGAHPTSALKSCSTCNGTGSLRRTEIERIAALNKAIREWNIHTPAGKGAIVMLATADKATGKVDVISRRWARRIDDAVGYIRSNTDYGRALRKKLG